MPALERARPLAGESLPAAANAKLVLFLLSPRLIDFDTYLPTALALKEARPGWDIRFVTLSRANAESIARNPTLTAGLARCGTLACLEASDAGGWLARQWARMRHVAAVSGWLLGARRPVLFSGVTFGALPYLVWYLAAKARGGRALVLLKSRATEDNHQLAERERQAGLSQEPRGVVERVTGPLYDGLIRYHDQQEMQLYGMRLHGRVPRERQLKLGLPNLAPAWRTLIADETAAERARLGRLGHDMRAEVYTFFPVKGFGARTLRTPDSPADTFRLVLKTLRRLRPGALILIRLHPVAENDAFVHQTLAEMDDPNIVITRAHPEVLIAMSRRVIFNGPTNIQTTCLGGRFIDCTDYSPRHYAEMGERSLVEGYGTVFVRPTGEDFEARLARALGDDSLFAASEVEAKRQALVAENPFTLAPLLAWMERGVSPA
ncbi:MAG: hypothetical protein WCF16_12830 [Alphaproteobacteria bacterium]